MKKLIPLLSAILFANFLIAADGPGKEQVAESNFFAAQAKKQFSLSDEAAEKVLQLKLDSFVHYRERVYNLRKAGRDSEADAAAKEVAQDLMKQFCEIAGCKPKDYWTFARESKEAFQQQN
ncbi:MAG: hypothetical protein VKI81_11315 [Synechococcaceae cyanobacterium]|nr:hypothetical protein [Synechococcaceae cyanobacterium]